MTICVCRCWFRTLPASARGDQAVTGPEGGKGRVWVLAGVAELRPHPTKHAASCIVFFLKLLLI